MNRLGRGVVVALVLMTVLWALVLGISPKLHKAIHPGATSAEHTCAATLLATGKCEKASPPAGLLFSLHHEPFVRLPMYCPEWVASPFLNSAIFEHAPPTYS